MFENEDIQELLIDLLVYKMSLEDCEERKRYLCRRSSDPIDKMLCAVDALIPNKKHVFKRYPKNRRNWH